MILFSQENNRTTSSEGEIVHYRKDEQTKHGDHSTIGRGDRCVTARTTLTGTSRSVKSIVFLRFGLPVVQLRSHRRGAMIFCVRTRGSVQVRRSLVINPGSDGEHRID